MQTQEQLAGHWLLLTLITSTLGGAPLRIRVDQTRIFDRTIRGDYQFGIHY